MATVPPGRSTRRSRAGPGPDRRRTSRRTGTRHGRSWHRRMAALPPPRCRHTTGSDARATIPSIPSLRSSPTTPAPTRRAAARATTPVPQPTSSTVSPTVTPAASSTGTAHWAKSAGTNTSSYTSAALAADLSAVLHPSWARWSSAEARGSSAKFVLDIGRHDGDDGIVASYQQYCPVARACEILTERWSVLIVRNLMWGASSFTELAQGVPTCRARCSSSGCASWSATDRGRHPEGQRAGIDVRR